VTDTPCQSNRLTLLVNLVKLTSSFRTRVEICLCVGLATDRLLVRFAGRSVTICWPHNQQLVCWHHQCNVGILRFRSNFELKIMDEFSFGMDHGNWWLERVTEITKLNSLLKLPHHVHRTESVTRLLQLKQTLSFSKSVDYENDTVTKLIVLVKLPQAKKLKVTRCLA
jgi:hypothetical protein